MKMVCYRIIKNYYLYMKKRILIVAKTYPCPSTKYGELVCTAGIDETGKWHRLYPVQELKVAKLLEKSIHLK
jgi:hypothetical protein